MLMLAIVLGDVALTIILFGARLLSALCDRLGPDHASIIQNKDVYLIFLSMIISVHIMVLRCRG